jgi:hypothetical protein
MNRFVPALAALVLAAPAAAAPPLAPAVTRPPSASPAPAPSAPAATASSSPAATSAANGACGTAGREPCPSKRMTSSNPDDYRATLAASVTRQPGRDSTLDDGLVTAVSRLVAAGRCGDAATLATRSGQPGVAARATQLCAGN